MVSQAGHAHKDVHIAEMLKHIEALEAARSFATFMPELAERFHVIHRAGEVGDWAVAAHELAEMKRLTRQAVGIDAEQGKLMQSMLGPSFEELGGPVEHGNVKEFLTSQGNTIAACNAYHEATGAEFVQFTLDAPDRLRMRHPHRLMMRDAPEGHHHGPQGGHMMRGGHGGAAGGHEHAPGTPA